MRFFTEEKFAAGRSHREYAEYCREHWAVFPEAVRRLCAGMIPEDMLESSACVDLHDARIEKLLDAEEDVCLRIRVSGEDECAIYCLTYRTATVVKRPAWAVLGESDDADSDVMCHEFESVEAAGWNHYWLFGSGEVLQLRFERLDLTRVDNA